MHFTYCPHCGEHLIKKEIGDEAMIPFCESCAIPLWDTFTTCIIAAPDDALGLLREGSIAWQLVSTP